MNYKLEANGVVRLDNGAHIPADTRNRDWREYTEWLAKGNTPLPVDPEPPRKKRLSADALAALLVSKGVVTQTEVDDA